VTHVCVAGAGAILSSGLMKLASFDTVKAFVDTAMQGDPSKTVMSGGKIPRMQHVLIRIPVQLLCRPCCSLVADVAEDFLA